MPNNYELDDRRKSRAEIPAENLNENCYEPISNTNVKENKSNLYIVFDKIEADIEIHEKEEEDFYEELKVNLNAENSGEASNLNERKNKSTHYMNFGKIEADIEIHEDFYEELNINSNADNSDDAGNKRGENLYTSM